MNNTEDRLKTIGNLTIFLDFTQLLAKLLKAVETFCVVVQKNQMKRLPAPCFKCVIPIDLYHLHQKDEKIYDLFILEPGLAVELLSEIVLSALHQFENLRFMKIQDVLVTVSLTSVPPMQNNNSSLKHYRGVIVSQTFPTKYVRSCVWRCRDDSCEGSSGQRTGSSSPPACHYCTGPTDEDVRGRDLGEMVLCKLVPVTALQGTTGTFLTSLICIKDDVLNQEKLELGVEYDFVGVLTRNTLDVWKVSRHHHSVQSLVKSPHGHCVPLPPSVADLYLRVRERNETSMWGWTAELASKLAGDVIPHSALLHLKFGLLLSLASVGRYSKPVGVVAVGGDTLMAKTLMNAVCNLADRRVSAVGHSLEGSLKLESSSGLVWEEAGFLQLATDGVCLLGDWEGHRHDSAQVIASMETGRVTPRGLASVTSHGLPLRSCMWTYWGHISGKVRDQLQLRTLIDVFGMPFLSDESIAPVHEGMCMGILEAAVNSNFFEKSRNVLLPEDLRQFLLIITARDIELTEGASELIKRYFVASRLERPECLPVGAVTTIASLAEAHARLSLRQQVDVADVALVIFLYQEAINTLFGISQNSYKLTWDQEDSISSFIDQQMTQFMDWMYDYISTL